MTNAMPLGEGTFFKNCSMASSPPADAPMPTMGNAPAAAGTGLSGSLADFGFFDAPKGLDKDAALRFVLNITVNQNFDPSADRAGSLLFAVPFAILPRRARSDAPYRDQGCHERL